MHNNIFISYAREDYQYADTLHEFLANKGFAPWMDKKNLLPGQQWDTEIQQALRKADYIIILISSNSVTKRGYIQREFRLALDYCNEKLDSDIYIIPVKIDECEVPHGLSKFQWIEYNSIESKNKILESLHYQQREYLKIQSTKHSYQTTDIHQSNDSFEPVVEAPHLTNVASEPEKNYSTFLEEIKQLSRQIRGNKVRVKEGNLILVDYNMIFKKNRLRLFVRGIIVTIGLLGIMFLLTKIDIPNWIYSGMNFFLLVSAVYAVYFLVEFIYCKIFYNKFLSIDLLTFDIRFDNSEIFSFNSHQKIYFTKAYNSRRYFVSVFNDVKMVHLAVGNSNIMVFEKILEKILTYHNLETTSVLKEVTGKTTPT